jgi:hypothetical protein
MSSLVSEFVVESVSRLGIVVWVNAASETVMVWCEDCRNMAVAVGAAANTAAQSLPEVGDLVEVSVTHFGRLRECSSLRVVDRNYFPAVAETLLSA